MDYYYIPLAEDSKRPVLEWDGWPIDPSHENIFEREHVETADWNNWAIVGSSTGNLLVIDVDTYKMNDDALERIDTPWNGLLERTRIVSTQSGGTHVYFLYDGTRDDLLNGDTQYEPIDFVDLKGDVGRGYAIAPQSPGYEIESGSDPFPVSRDELLSLPVFREKEEQRNEPGVEDRTLYSSMYPPCLDKSMNLIGSDEPEAQEALAFVKKFLAQDGIPDEEIREIIEVNWSGSRVPDLSDPDYAPGLNVYDVLPSSQFPEDKRVEHPHFLHTKPSESKANFMVDAGGETFRCWRHDVTGNALHLIGVKEGIIKCGDWEFGLSSDTWTDIFRAVKEDGHEIPKTAIDCTVIEDNGLCPYNCGRDFALQRGT